MSEIKTYELDKTSDKAKSIVAIHRMVFPDFFLTHLGMGFLTTLYQVYEDAESRIIIAENEANKQIIGFIACSKDYFKFYSELKRNHLVKFAMCSLGAAIKHLSFIKVF